MAHILNIFENIRIFQRLMEGALSFIIILDSAKVPVRDIFPKKITGKILIKPLNS